MCGAICVELLLPAQIHGDEHPDTATAIQSLALLYQAMGRSNEALRLMKRVLAMREKVI